MKDQLFGIGIEMTGISRRMVAGVLAEYFDSSARHTGGRVIGNRKYLVC